MAVDYHIHTARCGHAKGRIPDYVRRAEELGLAEIGFADHLPLIHKTDSSLTMSRDELPVYVEEVGRIASEAAIPVRLGIEADYVLPVLDEVEELLGEYPFDYVLGSVHFLGDWAFDDPRCIGGYEGRDHRQLYEQYFSTAVDAVACGLFDVLAHPDLIKKFDILPSADLSEHYVLLATAVAAQNMAIEVSTAGLRKPVGEIYPALEFLKICRALDVPVTLGSDAHSPEEVGYKFATALELLADAGYDEIAVYEGRQRSMVPIGEGGSGRCS